MALLKQSPKMSTLVLIISACLLATFCIASADNLIIVASAKLGQPIYWSSVCVLNDTFIAVNQDGLNANSLSLLLYAIKPDGNITIIQKNTSYGQGVTPYIVAYPTAKLVIEVHSDNNGSLYYMIGELNKSTISWKTKESGVLYTTDGYEPSVAVTDNGTVIAAFHGQTNQHSLYYCMGHLDPTTHSIRWFKYNTSTGSCIPTYIGVPGITPRIYITKDNTVVMVHSNSTPSGVDSFYSIGKLQTIDKNNMTIVWVVKALKYENCPHVYCADVDAFCSICLHTNIMVDPFGVVMEVHNIFYVQEQVGPNGWPHSWLTKGVYYKVGLLHENYIEWNDSNSFDMGRDNAELVTEDSDYVHGHPAVTFMNGSNYLYSELHSAINCSQVVINTLVFDVQLVNITYGQVATQGKAIIRTITTNFVNNGSKTCTQNWTLNLEYTCTNTYNWESELHYGISASADIYFFGAGASTKANTSINFNIGKSSSVFKNFTWTQEQEVSVPPRTGKLTYSAEIYCEVHTIPFVATFKRGSTTWSETGSVDVTHGVIFSSISSV